MPFTKTILHKGNIEPSSSAAMELDNDVHKVVGINELFGQWKKASEHLISSFLDDLKKIIIQPKKPSIIISYTKQDKQDKRTITAINQLKKYFNQLKFLIEEQEYKDTACLEEILNSGNYSHAIILVTPKYKELAAASQQQEEKIKKVLDEFGRRKDALARLHVLLCEGSFNDVALKIIDGKYLIRDYIKVFNKQIREYELCLASELPKDGIPLIGKIYLDIKENKLNYTVLSPRGELISAFLNISISQSITKEFLNSKKEKILKHTAKRGHTERSITSDFQEQSSLLNFIDHMFNPCAYAYGIGILPSMLNLSGKEYDEQYKQYKNLFYDFYREQQKLNLEYRFKKILLESYKKNEKPLSYLIKTSTVNQQKLQQQINEIIDNLLKSTNLKTNLILCQGTLDETLVNWILERQLMLRKNAYVISIDCGRRYKIKDQEYPGCGVLDFLQEKLCLKQHEIEEFTKQTEEPVIILFKNYDRLGIYENLYLKNKLANWPNLKMLVTCEGIFFQHRSYESCFLPDPGIIDLSSIKCDKISSIFMQDSNYAFKETTDILRPEGLRRSSIVEIAGTHNKNDITKVKLIATQTELTNFLKIINKTFTENQTLHPKIENNPQVFISYAWEPVGASRTRQQNHLKQLAKDLYTLGFIAWLDLERMIGNIDQQMEGNIESSRYVLIIGTPLYTQRAGLETNVQKEFLAIIKKKEIQKDQITIFPVRFLSKGLTADEHQEYESFPFQLTSNDDYDNLLDFRDIDNGEEYVKQLISPYNPIGLIPRLLRLNKSDNIAKFSVHTKYDNASKFSEYTKYYNAFINQLKLLPASHLLADKGQEDAQAYDIDRRLEIYIEPYGVKINPTQTTEIIPKFNLKKSLSDFLEHPNLKTYAALGDAGSGKTLFTLWAFKQYMLQPWHNYRNKELKIYLCNKAPKLLKMEPNTVYLHLEEDQIQYICLVKNYKHEDDPVNKKEAQVIAVTETTVPIYNKIKEKIIQLKQFSSATELKFSPNIHDKNEFFSMIKPKWLPIYVPLKNYAYLGENQTPQQYIEDALLTDYHISLEDLLELKKGLNHQQNILFILDGYDELGKGNNPNFSQALLNSYEDILLCPQKPTESAIQEEFLYIYLKQEKPYLLLKKVEQAGKTTTIDKQISGELLIEQLKLHLVDIKSTTPLLNATIIEALFRYTVERHQKDLQAHGLRWKYAKIFVTGRPEHFDNEQQYQAAFALLDKQNPISFEVNYMAIFTPEEIKKYIIEYKQADHKCEQELTKLEKSHSKTTFQILESFGNLKELLTNPFLLNITLQVLPILTKKTDINITRASIYEAFIEYWYTKEIARKEKALSVSSKTDYYRFAESLAMQMFINNTISIRKKFSELWTFFNTVDKLFARETCPLRRFGNEYSFIHKSVYEYFLARHLITTPWEDIIQGLNNPELGYNASIARLLKEEPSVFSFIQDFARPFLLKAKQPHINISSSTLQEENLYKIFLELLRWNEIPLAERLITGKTEASSTPPVELTKLAYESLLKEDATLIQDIIPSVELTQIDYESLLKEAATLIQDIIPFKKKYYEEDYTLLNCFHNNNKPLKPNTIAIINRSILIGYRTWRHAEPYLLKPFNPEHLKQQLNTHIKHFEQLTIN